MRDVHGWRRATRWLLGIAGGLLGLVVLVLGIAFIVFQTGWGRGILRDQIASRLQQTFVGGASLGSVDGNPFTELVLHDVVINDRTGAPAIEVERLAVKLPLLPLISHELRVDKVIVEDLDVRARKLDNGDWNLANLRNPSEPSTWNVKLPDVQVHRGHIRVEQGGGAEPIDVDDLEVYVDAALPFAGPIDANARITGQWRQKQAPLSIGGVIHGDDRELSVRNAGIQVGDVRVLALGVTIPKGSFARPLSGTVAVNASARAVHDLVPSVTLPADIALSANARGEGRLTYFEVLGAIGSGRIHAFGRADVQAKLASIVASAANLDIGTLSKGAIDGTGGAFATLQVAADAGAELPTASGVITAWSDMQDAPRLEAAIAIDMRDDLIRTTLGANSDSGVHASAGAVVRKRGDQITLERGDLIARTLDVRRATVGKAPLRGVLSANLHAEGALAPEMDLAVEGHANGRRLRMQGASADRLALRIDAKHLPKHPVGSGRVELYDVQRGDLAFSKLTVAAGNRPDGKLQVSVRSQPKPAPWRVDLDALVTTGDTIVVDLQRHFVRAGGGSMWRGTTGRVTISPRKVEVRDVRSTSGDGSFSADAMYVRAGRDKGDLSARIDAAVELGSLLQGRKGRIDAHVDVERANNRFAGIIDAQAKDLMLDPGTPIAIDANAKIQARADQLLANVDVTTAKSGSAKLVLDVDAPKDITNMRAWRTLGRDAIRTAQVSLDHVKLEDVAKLAHAEPLTGDVDGTVELSPDKAGGTLAIRGVQVPQTKDVGTISADLTVAQAGKGEMKTSLTARLEPSPGATAAKDLTQNGQARLFAEAAFQTPDRIFDPAAWRRLGAAAFRGGMLRAERLAFQPGTLERFGIVSPLRGELAVGAEIAPGLDAVRFAGNVYGLRGGLFAQPVAISVVGAIDDTSTRARADVRAHGITLVHVGAEVPLTLAEARANPAAAKTKAVKAQARIPHVPAKALMNVIGTSQITGGTLDGTIDIGGTIGKPTVDASLVAHDVSVPSSSTHRIQQIKQLTIAATWDGTAGEVAIDGDQSAGGKLRIRAAGSPDELDAVIASIEAKNVDIAPLVAFMPGPAGGLGGKLEASFTLRGANPKTADLSGTLHIEDGRIPIAPAIGTLFQGDVRVEVRNKVFGMKMTGKLGRGDVTVSANAPLDGVTPKSGKAQVTVRNVQLIGKTEPILSGVIDADLARIGDTWRSNVRVTKMHVKVPEEKGIKLSPVGAPDDLVYGGEKIHHGKNKGKDVPKGLVKDAGQGPVDFKPPNAGEKPGEREPTRADNPALVAYIQLRNVFVESEEVRGLVGGRLTVALDSDKDISVVGNVALSRAVLDLFSRRYTVDKAALHFDGSTDPVLDIRITHDFPEITTITEVRGRMSDPELMLSSEPAIYSQAELLGFLLGGEPGGDPDRAPSATERVAGAGASFLGNKIGGYVKKALPVDVDVLRYEAESSTSSAAVTVGTWISDTLFLAYRRHLEARPDENTGEGQVEYWIQRRLVLEGVIGDRGVNGADLLWRRRW